jgi:polysaccharide pyruvyl transferase CsaB
VKVLVAAWVGSPNVGDELVFRALRRKLVARGAEVAAISISPNKTSIVHRVRAISSKDPARVLSAIRSADALVLGGGGLIQDETSHLNLPYHLSRVWPAKMMRTPFAGIGLGAAGLRGRFAGWLVGSTLRGHQGITVRDPGSAALLESLGIRDISTAADLVFSLPVEERAPADRLAISLRAWPQRGKILPMSLRWKRELRHSAIIARLGARIDEIAERHGLHTRFVAFHQGRDDVLHAMVAERMRTSVSLVSPTPDEMSREIGGAVALITMRYHGGILAAMHGRPTVFVGGSAKLQALSHALDPGAAILGRDISSIDHLPGAVDLVLGKDQAIRKAAARLREMELGNDVVIDRLLDRGSS